MGLDDSALGRFRNQSALSARGFDFNQLSYHSRSDSSSSTSSKISFPLVDDMALTALGEHNLAAAEDDNDGIPEVDLLEISATDPELEYRYVRSSNMYGHAPFRKPHFVSSSTAPPFSGPHTAISIPLGSDYGRYMHISRTLRAADMGLVELAIYWLWTGIRKDEGTGQGPTPPVAGPIISPSILARNKIGPPAAPYPMSESTFPAFVGPRTFILNTGAVLNGWLLQIPRYLSQEEIVMASDKLQDITNEVSQWSVEFDSSCRLGVKRSVDEQSVLAEYLEQQNRNMTLLKEVMGLDFAAQDDKRGTSVPIWDSGRQETVNIAIETPKKMTMLPTPPSTVEKKSQSPHPYSISPVANPASPSSRYLTGKNAVVSHANVATAANHANTSSQIAEDIVAWHRSAPAFPTIVVPKGRLGSPRSSNTEHNDIEADVGHSSQSGHPCQEAVGLDTTANEAVSNVSIALVPTASTSSGKQTARPTNSSKSAVPAEAKVTYENSSTHSICDVILVAFCSLILFWLLFTEFS